MNRYNVTNSENGLQFSVEADVMPDPMPPEWGQNPVVDELDITQELADEAARSAENISALSSLKFLRGKPVLTNQEIQDAVKWLIEINS